MVGTFSATTVSSSTVETAFLLSLFSFRDFYVEVSCKNKYTVILLVYELFPFILVHLFASRVKVDPSVDTLRTVLQRSHGLDLYSVTPFRPRLELLLYQPEVLSTKSLRSPDLFFGQTLPSVVFTPVL